MYNIHVCCLKHGGKNVNIDDTHNLKGKEHAHNVLDGAVCVHCERLPMSMCGCSRLEGQPSAEICWGQQVDLADKLGKGLSFSRLLVHS